MQGKPSPSPPQPVQPVRGTVVLKVFTSPAASWPVIASTTRRVSVGLTAEEICSGLRERAGAWFLTVQAMMVSLTGIFRSTFKGHKSDTGRIAETQKQ